MHFWDIYLIILIDMNQERTKNVSTNNMYDQKNNYYYCKPLNSFSNLCRTGSWSRKVNPSGQGYLKTKKHQSPLSMKAGFKSEPSCGTNWPTYSVPHGSIRTARGCQCLRGHDGAASGHGRRTHGCVRTSFQLGGLHFKHGNYCSWMKRKDALSRFELHSTKKQNYLNLSKTKPVSVKPLYGLVWFDYVDFESILGTASITLWWICMCMCVYIIYA